MKPAGAEHRLEQPGEVTHSEEGEERVLLQQLGVVRSTDSSCGALRKLCIGDSALF